jgi:hypothetical protein
MSSNNNERNRESRLLKMLYRADCPPSVELGEFQLGLLARPRSVWIGRHVADCPHCNRELAALNSFMSQVATQLPTAEVDPPIGILAGAGARLKVLVAQLFTPAPGQAAWAVRGEETADAPQIFNVGDIQVAIETAADPQQPAQRSILGLISGADTLGWRAHVWQAGQFVLTVEVDEFGNFTVPPVAVGNYQILLEGADSGDTLEVHLDLTV